MSESGSKAKKKEYHSQDSLDPKRRDCILEYSKNGKLPCAVAFQIVENMGMPANEIGKYTDQMDIRIVKCQLGLFGHRPVKKIVKSGEPVDEPLKKAIHQKIIRNRLSCIDAWKIASEFGIGKLAVSSACETLSIKIYSCQLGAF
jgi:hypothetical protein